jgi:hypothetical protein
VAYLEVFLGITQVQAQADLDAVIAANAVPIRDQFNAQRAAHNAELYPAGGSPTNDNVWGMFQARPLRGAKGKYIYRQLKNRIPQGRFSDANILAHELGGLIGLDLKHELERVLAAA